MPKENGEWWNGGWQRKGKSEWKEEKESSFRDNDLGSVTLIEKSAGFWVDEEPGKFFEATQPSANKAEKRKLPPAHQVESKKSKDDESNELTCDDLLKIYNQLHHEISSVNLTNEGIISFDDVDLPCLNDVDLSYLNDVDFSWLDSYQDNNAELPLICSLQEKSTISQQYQMPLINYHQKNDANKVFSYLAFDIVRERFSKLGVKSGNKRTPSDIKSMERLKRASFVVFDVQSEINSKYISEGINDFSLSMEKGAGNCGEMSGVVAQIINASGGKAAQYRVDDSGTHAFALSGEPPISAIDHINMSDYSGCWVIDPWAGIVCEANNYCEEFTRKMNKWALKGKEVYSHGGWMEANNPLWINAVVKGEKKVNIPHDRFKVALFPKSASKS
ncbi:hypothetical protein [Aeromonas veronii]|uniref:hypothetical protein n=1 Tax=Aeromonas veronii TaxID=654 RepID=UPI003D258ED7